VTPTRWSGNIMIRDINAGGAWRMISDMSSTDVTVSYCERWNNKQKKPIFPMSEDEARARHASGALYTAVLGDHETRTVVEVFLKEGYVGVRWLEPHGKNEMRYAFRRTEDRLFLSEVAINTVSAEGKVVAAESTLIKPAGTVEMSLFDNVNRTVKTAEPQVSKDVTAMWEDIPQFGDYASITRRER
jgi:hypothetical protein